MGWPGSFPFLPTLLSRFWQAGRPARRLLWRGLLLFLAVVQRRFEIADPLTQTLAEFRDFLAAEYQHRDAEDDQQLGNSETEGHNNLRECIPGYCNPEN